MVVSAEDDVYHMDDTVGGPIVHLDDIPAGSFAAYGDERPSEVFCHGDFLPGARHHRVRSGRESRGQDEAGGHVTEQRRLQGGGASQQLLEGEAAGCFLLRSGLTCSFSGGSRSKAAFVGAKTVTGSGPESLSTRPAALTAVTRLEKVGLTARVSKTEQARPQVPGGIWNCRLGGEAGRGGRKGPGDPKGPPKGVPKPPNGN